MIGGELLGGLYEPRDKEGPEICRSHKWSSTNFQQLFYSSFFHYFFWDFSWVTLLTSWSFFSSGISTQLYLIYLYQLIKRGKSSNILFYHYCFFALIQICQVIALGFWLVIIISVIPLYVRPDKHQTSHEFSFHCHKHDNEKIQTIWSLKSSTLIKHFHSTPAVHCF